MMTSRTLPRKANITDDAGHATTRHKNSQTLCPDFVELLKEPLIGLNGSELVLGI